MIKRNELSKLKMPEMLKKKKPAGDPDVALEFDLQDEDSDSKEDTDMGDAMADASDAGMQDDQDDSSDEGDMDLGLDDESAGVDDLSHLTDEQLMQELRKRKAMSAKAPAY